MAIEREGAALRREARPDDRRVWCAGCGARWQEPEGFIFAGVVHLCGDCWRKVQPILHANVCGAHGDPLVCLACEAEEHRRPIWQIDLEPLRALARTHRVPRDPFAEQLSGAILTLASEVEQLREAESRREARQETNESRSPDGDGLVGVVPTSARPEQAPSVAKRADGRDNREVGSIPADSQPRRQARVGQPQDLTGLIEKACDWLTMHAPQPDPTMQEGVDLLDFFVKAAIIERDRSTDAAPLASPDGRAGGGVDG